MESGEKPAGAGVTAAQREPAPHQPQAALAPQTVETRQETRHREQGYLRGMEPFLFGEFTRNEWCMLNAGLFAHTVCIGLSPDSLRELCKYASGANIFISLHGTIHSHLEPN